MKSLRFVCSFAAFLFAILVIVLVAAQSNPLARVNQPSALHYQKLPAGVAPQQLASGAQKSPLKFAKPVSYLLGGMIPRSVAVADLNGDGKPDLVVATEIEGAAAVLLGNGDGTFGQAVYYPTAGFYAESVAIADVNGDGKLDLVVATKCQTKNTCTGFLDPGGVSVLLGNGDGTFQAAVGYNSGGLAASSVAIADVNGDGIPDLIVTNPCSSVDPNGNCTSQGVVSILVGNGDGTFQTAVSYSSGGLGVISVAVADVNGDGIRDLAVVNDGSDSVGVLLGNGDGTFKSAVSFTASSDGYDPLSVAVADVNGDGKPDLVVTINNGLNHHGAVSILLGNGDGAFQAPVSYDSGGKGAFSLAVADVNGDGTPDLVVSIGLHYQGAVSILPGNGDGTFQAAVRYPSAGIIPGYLAVADVNTDGRPDLLVANKCTNRGCSIASVRLNSLMVNTTTKVKSSPDPSHVSQSVTFTATISSNSSVPNSSVVTFYNGAMQIGTGETTDGVATFTTSFSTAGTYNIKASYPGDAFHKASSGIVKQVVNP